jgi:hypothetical protein
MQASEARTRRVKKTVAVCSQANTKHETHGFSENRTDPTKQSLEPFTIHDRRTSFTLYD